MHKEFLPVDHSVNLLFLLWWFKMPFWRCHKGRGWNCERLLHNILCFHCSFNIPQSLTKTFMTTVSHPLDLSTCNFFVFLKKMKKVSHFLKKFSQKHLVSAGHAYRKLLPESLTEMKKSLGPMHSCRRIQVTLTDTIQF